MGTLIATLRRRNGFSLVEILVVATLMSGLIVLGVGAKTWYYHNASNKITATQMRIVARGGEDYVKVNFASVQAAATPTSPAIITAAQLAAYVPQGFNFETPYGQTLDFRVTEPTPGIFDAMVLSHGGQPMDGDHMRNVARYLSTPGGYITAEAPDQAYGLHGGWEKPLAAFGGTPGAGHLALALSMRASTNCTVPVPVITTGACPVGQTGAITFTNTGSCPSSSGLVSWTGPVQTGNTCAPSAPPPPSGCAITSGMSKSWVPPNGNFCSGTATFVGTLANGGSITFTDSTPTLTGSANYICNSGLLALSGTPTCDSAPTCVVPSPSTQTQSLSCAAGQYGTITQARTASCPSPTGSVSWSSWTTTSNTCTACPASSIEKRWVSTTNGTCPVGQIGSTTREKEQKRTKSYSCPSGTTSLPAPTFSAWTDTGALREIANTCADSCLAPASTSSATTRAASSLTGSAADCPSGQFGSHTWSQSRTENGTITTSWTCPGPTSSTSTAWLGTFNLGTKTTTGGSCTACPAPTSSTAKQWVPTSNGTCPAGQTGAVTREKEQAQTSTTSYSCPAGTAALPAPGTSSTGWVDTGAVRDVSSTCAPITCSFQPRTDVWTVFNPKVGGALVCLPYDTQFACSDGSASIEVVVGTPVPGPACNVVSTPPTPSSGTTVNPQPSRFGTITTGPKKY